MKYIISTLIWCCMLFVYAVRLIWCFRSIEHHTTFPTICWTYGWKDRMPSQMKNEEHLRKHMMFFICAYTSVVSNLWYNRSTLFIHFGCIVMMVDHLFRIQIYKIDGQPQYVGSKRGFDILWASWASKTADFYQISCFRSSRLI